VLLIIGARKENAFALIENDNEILLGCDIIMEGIREKPESEITFKGLRIFNGIMGGLHLVQGIIMLVFGLVNDTINSFKLPITTDFLEIVEIPGQDMPGFIISNEVLWNVPLGAATAFFLFMSAIAHFLTVLPKVNDFYNRNLSKGINYFRWFEYALSSSLMIVLIAMLFGVYNLGALLMMVGLNATMNLMGLMMEIHNQSTEKTNWTAFYIGWFAGILPWIIIIIYLTGIEGAENAPWFVWALLGGYFLFFNTFPINMYLQYKKIGKWADYLYGERWYIILSLTSKTLLAWLTFAGTLRPL
jgi:hypothetical protein